MVEVEPSLFQEIKKNKFSNIAKFSEEDVAAVLESVSRFIEKQMTNQKGVNIPNLGTFTFSQRNIDLGHARQIMVQRPIFQVAERFAQMHALNYTKHYVTGQIPILPLNFTAIATELPYSRELVESCVKEVIQAVSRSLYVKRNVEFVFAGIGCLSIRDLRVKMKFFKEFVKAIDKTGELVNALKNRPDTSDSVFSEIIPLRPTTGNTLILPRIDMNSDDKSADEDCCPTGSVATPKPTMNKVDENLLNAAVVEPNAVDKKLISPAYANVDGRNRFQAGILNPPGTILDNPNEVPHRPLSCPHAIKLRRLSRTSNGREGMPNHSDASPPATTGKITLKSPNFRCCHNNKAGQELCYLCHQRKTKNIPIYFAEEIRKRDLENDRCLQQYQCTKDQDAIHQEYVKQMANRKRNEETAAFNVGVSEAINEKKNTRSTDFHRSFLFRNRPMSPLYSQKQAEYSSDLKQQVEEKNRLFIKEKTDKDIQDRLEQIQLAEELARQREQFIQDKKLDMQHYRDALNSQALFKSLPLPIGEPDPPEPVFGRNDNNREKMKEKREQARKLYHEQLAMVADKKRAAILSDLTSQREESAMLDKIKKDLQLERARTFYEAVKTRHALEKSWAETMRQKAEREHEEKARTRSPGVLIQEQCSKYNRCQQCGRRPWNCGESNIWRESRYIGGSRLII